jgi:hypothetical protein
MEIVVYNVVCLGCNYTGNGITFGFVILSRGEESLGRPEREILRCGSG